MFLFNAYRYFIDSSHNILYLHIFLKRNYCKLSVTKYSNTMCPMISMGVVFQLPLGISETVDITDTI